MKKVLLFTVAIFSIFVLISFVDFAQKTPADYVNPFIGTGGHGHTFPGAILPFGMVQLSPDTRLDGWDGCSGYHYSDSIIYGFTHTHLSGTGCLDYGDILLMPTTGEVIVVNGAKTSKGYSSTFSHKNEIAEAGYYSVLLDKYQVKAELTTTTRVGFHQYTFPESKEANIIVDLQHRDEVLASELKIVNNQEIEGMRRSKAWATDQHIYFVAQFSKPFTSYGIAIDDLMRKEVKMGTGKNVKAWLSFSTSKNEKILVKVGISGVSIEGARKNLDAELKGWDFEKTRQVAKEIWNKELSKIQIDGGSDDQKSVFYTALYHCFTSPFTNMDVDNKYRGRDLAVHSAADFTNYSVFSLWDTYRGLHPLLTILDQKRTNDFIKTFIAQYEQGGLLPVWELSGNETNCMIGYHAIPVIVDAYMKGIRGFDINKAYKAMKASALSDQFGLSYYKKLGYIPAEKEIESVSKTLEYGYDDWCIAQVAKALKNTSDYNEFIKRAQSYKNIFDPSTGFMRARVNGGWFSPFRPDEVNFNYTEANSWQYSFAVQQDINGLMNCFGGKEAMAKKLDDLFNAVSQTSGRQQSDITGLIGQYAHGNEPSHHMAYLYNSVGKPWKTQELVHKIMSEFYTNQPDGLIGNEDCGQMSAWAVLSAMGFYSVSPGSNQYAIGTPMFPVLTLNLENNKKLVIRANNLSDKNFYIKSAKLNGKELNRSFITHSEILAGGELVFGMSNVASQIWGVGAKNEPSTSISDNQIVPIPFVSKGAKVFSTTQKIALGSFGNSQIYYTLDGSVPTANSMLYKDSIEIKENIKIKFMAVKKGLANSNVVEAEFVKITQDRTIKLNTKYENQYAANGLNTLIDKLRGDLDFRLGGWQGYHGENIDAEVNLGAVKTIKKLSITCLQDINSWLFMPSEVEFFISADGKKFTSVGIVKNDVPLDKSGTLIKDFTLSVAQLKTQFVKVVAKSIKVCPASHPGAGSPAWVFADEITTE